MAQSLTDLERRVLDYLVEYLREHTYQPSIREIGQHFGIKSTKTVSELLQSLAAKGWIERDASRSRGVRLLGVEMRPDAVTVPCVGPHAAPDEHYEIDRKLAGGSGAFLVTAGPACGIDGVRPEDLLLTQPLSVAAEEGDVLALRTSNGWLFGTMRGGRVEVPTATGTARAVSLGGEIEVAGRVVCVLRRIGRPQQLPATSS